jgi:predicted PurR-regulated permease PerM
LARFRLPRPLAVIVALCFGCLFIGVVAVVVLSSINELAANSTKYTERIHAMVNWLIQASP